MMKMFLGEFRSTNCSCEMPMAAMMLNMTQNSPLTIAWGKDAKRPPNLPAKIDTLSMQRCRLQRVYALMQTWCSVCHDGAVGCHMT